MSRSRAMLYWAAGFLEGEGTFYRAHRSFGIDVAQVDVQPLKRLQLLFGGSLILQKRTPRNNPWGSQDRWRWRVSGARARGIALTLLPLLSGRRWRQIREAL